MRPNPAKARPKKLKMASVADVGDDDLEVISETIVGCYAALARGLACTAAFHPLFLPFKRHCQAWRMVLKLKKKPPACHHRQGCWNCKGYHG